MTIQQNSELFDASKYEADLPPASSLGELTLERVRKFKPGRFMLAVQLLGEGLSQRQTAKATGLSRNVVAQIYEAEADAIKPLNKETAKLARRVARMSLERLEEEIDQVPLASLAIIFGVTTDKAELLSGNATERIEHIKQEQFGDLDEIYKTLPGDDAIDVSQMTETTDLSSEGAFAKGGQSGSDSGAYGASVAGAGDDSDSGDNAKQEPTGRAQEGARDV